MSGLPATALHLHIRRLVVDADAVEGPGAPGDVAARLRERLTTIVADASARGGAHSGPRDAWIDALADGIASHLASRLPDGTR